MYDEEIQCNILFLFHHGAYLVYHHLTIYMIAELMKYENISLDTIYYNEKLWKHIAETNHINMYLFVSCLSSYMVHKYVEMDCILH